MADNNTNFDINITDNKLKVLANLSYSQDNGNKITTEKVLSMLQSKGVNTGIRYDVIKTMCESKKSLKNIVLAEAIPPKVGEKARIESYFDINRHRKAHKREDGSIDFRDLGEICSAKKGQELYRKFPPTIGEPGIDVCGNKIPGIPGKDLNIVLGSGTEIDENDRNLVRAAQDGKIILKNGIIQISRVHKINGDVDFSTGNIKFNGSVKIRGSVKAGFKVEASGDIEINGNVEDSVVIGENDIIIMGGYVGNGEGQICAGRDVHVKFVENQVIKAKRDIIIHGESYHSNLNAGRSIIANGGKGIIVGGQSKAKISVKAGRFGSTATTPTVIKAGIDPKLAEQIKRVEDEIMQTHKSHEKLEKSIVFLYRYKIDNNGRLPLKKNELLKNLEKTKKMIPRKLNFLQTTLDNLRTEQEDVENAYITAGISVSPKVKIFIGDQLIAIDYNLGPSTFKMVNGNVVRLSK